MDFWIIAVIMLVFLTAGGVAFFLARTGKTKISNTVNLNIVSDMGVCRVVGDKEAFEMYFDNESIGFLVENGVITQFKSKTHPGYVKY
jgi:hypothetical protein